MRVAWTYRTSANAGPPRHRNAVEPLERRAELPAQPPLRLVVRTELVEPEQRGTHDRGRRGRTNGDLVADLTKARVDRGQNVSIRVLQHAAAQQHLDGLVRQTEARERDPCECDDLVREALHDRRGDRVILSLGEHEGS